MRCEGGAWSAVHDIPLIAQAAFGQPEQVLRGIGPERERIP